MIRLKDRVTLLWQARFFDYTVRVRTRLHRFLLMLLMLVLPLQTFAAAFMQGGAAMPQQVAQPQPAMLDDATMADCHESGRPHALPAQHDCKHCGVCALASALPVPAADIPAPMQTPRGFAAPPAEPFSGFIPDGPERPPRLALA